MLTQAYERNKKFFLFKLVIVLRALTFSFMLWSLTHISLASFFVGHKQTVQSQIRRHKTWRLIRVSTVSLKNVLLIVL